MAVYKVIQDIEAEDKLLGPLTLKGFIYLAIAGVLAFIDVRLLITGVPIYIKLPIVFVLFLPMLLFGVLASPLGRDQPTEVWLLSHVRFLLKPRIRIWDEDSADNLVTITAPKRNEIQLTKNFSQTEVQSRLQALATTLDSRGWVVKNSVVNLSDQPDYLNNASDDRLTGPAAGVQVAQVVDVHASDDIMDEQNNAIAQHFNDLMQQAEEQRRQATQDRLDRARGVTTGSQAFHQRAKSTGGKASVNTVTADDSAAKLELAQSGNALSVASIAHLANRKEQARQIGPGEVEISLH